MRLVSMLITFGSAWTRPMEESSNKPPRRESSIKLLEDSSISAAAVGEELLV